MRAFLFVAIRVLGRPLTLIRQCSDAQVLLRHPLIAYSRVLFE